MRLRNSSSTPLPPPEPEGGAEPEEGEDEEGFSLPEEAEGAVFTQRCRATSRLRGPRLGMYLQSEPAASATPPTPEKSASTERRRGVRPEGVDEERGGMRRADVAALGEVRLKGLAFLPEGVRGESGPAEHTSFKRFLTELTAPERGVWGRVWAGERGEEGAAERREKEWRWRPPLDPATAPPLLGVLRGVNSAPRVVLEGDDAKDAIVKGKWWCCVVCSSVSGRGRGRGR